MRIPPESSTELGNVCRTSVTGILLGGDDMRLSIKLWPPNGANFIISTNEDVGLL